LKVPENLGIKVNVKLSLCLIKHDAIKTYWGSGDKHALHVLTSGLDGMSFQFHAPTAIPAVSIAQEAMWAPEPVWTWWRGEKKSVFLGNRTLIVEAKDSHFTLQLA